MATIRLIVIGHDTWTDEQLDAIESAARGKIIRTTELDPGNTGRTKLMIRTDIRFNGRARAAILKAVQVIEPKAYWIELDVIKGGEVRI